MRRICRAAGNGVLGKYAIEISLISVAIAGTGFITEAMLAVEYIQATRLALIQAHPGVAFILVLMSLVKCKYSRFRLPTVLNLLLTIFSPISVTNIDVVID